MIKSSEEVSRELSPLMFSEKKKPQNCTNVYLRNGIKIAWIFFSLLSICVARALWQTYWPSQDQEVKTFPVLSRELVKPFNFSHNSKQVTFLAGQLGRPIPTGAFWLNLILEEGDRTVLSVPYAISVQTVIYFPSMLQPGIQVCYPASYRKTTMEYMADAFQADVIISTTEAYLTHHIEGYDHFSVSLIFETAHAGSYRLYLVKGSPYITTEFFKATPIINMGLFAFKTINGIRDEAITFGSDFEIVLSNGDVWLAIFSSAVQVKFTARNIIVSKPFSGVLRLAKLLVSSDKNIFLSYAPSYPIGGSFETEMLNCSTSAKLVYRWKTRGNGQLAMFALSHHVELLMQSTGKTSLVQMVGSYESTKGPVTLVIGKEWVMNEKLPEITWYAPRKILNETHKDMLLTQLRKDMDASIADWYPDFVYTFGKKIARLARLAIIAEEYGLTDIVEKGVAALERLTVPWLEGTNGNPFTYETQWGGIVTKNGAADVSADYGNGYFQDHHFHYGYFLYAFAVLIKLKPQFFTVYKKQLELVLGDIATEQENHQLFPVTRHKDFFDFHSWASGLFQDWTGKNQESVSEAVNAYYGVWMFGLATNNSQLANWGQILTAMELRAAKFYWQMSSDRHVYPPPFSENKMVGQVAELLITFSTFFGNRPEYVHGINILPFTPITELLLDENFVEQQYPVLLDQTKNTAEVSQDSWRSTIYLEHAIIDSLASFKELASVQGLDDGNSWSNSFYWIFTRNMTY